VIDPKITALLLDLIGQEEHISLKPGCVSDTVQALIDPQITELKNQIGSIGVQGVVGRRHGEVEVKAGGYWR
jgi:hypothetical protein